jgi:hypothetical protein
VAEIDTHIENNLLVTYIIASQGTADLLNSVNIGPPFQLEVASTRPSSSRVQEHDAITLIETRVAIWWVWVGLAIQNIFGSYTMWVVNDGTASVT